MSPLRVMLLAVLLAGMLAGGCTTDQQIFTNQRKTRIEAARLYNRADYDNAVGAYRNAVKTDPREYRSFCYMALTYERLGNYQKAVQAYKSSLKVMRSTVTGRSDTEFRQITMNLLAGCISKHDDNHLEQELLTKQAADMTLGDRDRGESYFLLAKIQRYSGDADSSLISYYKGSEVDRDDFWLQKEAGLYMLQLGKTKTAVRPIQRANELRARDAEVIAAMRQLKLDVPFSLTGDHNAMQPMMEPRQLPPVALNAGDAAPKLPDWLPLD
jgi:tetratricopeptide (TPR) repeat protein